MILLAIDPGKDSGFARFLDGALVECGLTNVDQPPEIFGDQLVIEMPVVYPHSPVPPNDLMQVAVDVGQFVRMARDSLMQYRLVAPSTWKGRVPKDKHQPRILDAMTSDELVILDAAIKRGKVPASKKHNVLDAIGIGLWAVGRLAR